jgi:hypothetical protein
MRIVCSLTPRLALTLVGALLVTACTNEAPTASEPDIGAEARQGALDIAGAWRSACLSQPQGDGSTLYATLSFDITDARWDLDYVLWGDDECASAKLLTVAIGGPYAVLGRSVTVEGAYDGRFDFNLRTMTPHVQDFADALASAPGCGDGDFSVGVASDVLEKGCAPFGQYPRIDCPADHDLFARVGDTLRFGERPADNDMCTEARRPKSLGTAVLQRVE